MARSFERRHSHALFHSFLPGVFVTERFLFAASLFLLMVSQAQAQSFQFQDGVSYEPHLHPIVMQGFSPLPYDIGGIRPGVHVEDLYDLRSRQARLYHLCTYRGMATRGSCRFEFSAGDLPGFDPAVRFETGVDRRTGTVLSVWVRPHRSEQSFSYEQIRELLVERWGAPQEEGETCTEWSPERVTEDQGRLLRSQVALCKTSNEPWQIRLLDPQLEERLRAFGDPPGESARFGREEWSWYPVWTPHEVLGVHAGMHPNVAAAVLGGRPGQMRCRPEGARLEETVCELGPTGLVIGGVPLVAIIQFDEGEWVNRLSLRSQWTPDDDEALRWHAAISAVLEERWGPRDPGDRERWPARVWVDSPFQTSVQKLWDYGSDHASEAETVYSVWVTTSVLGLREVPFP